MFNKDGVKRPMTKEEIVKQVVYQVERWRFHHSEKGTHYTLSTSALSFIAEVIENIKEDPSPAWRNTNFDVEVSQKLAIKLIPQVLNDVVRSIDQKKLVDGKITTWEVWHSFFKNLHKWCFIPKDF